MHAKLITKSPERTFSLILECGDDVVTALEGFAADQGLRVSRLTAVGAFECVTLGYVDWEREEYLHMQVDEQVEVLSLVGDIALLAGQPKLCAHVVLGRSDGSRCGGHLLSALVRPTLKVVLVDTPSYLKRIFEPMSGLALIGEGK